MRLLDRLELGGVELLVEVGSAVVGETVEALRISHLLNESSPGERRETHTRVAPRTDAEVRNRLRRQIPLIPHVLQDWIVDRTHPIPSFPGHARCLFRCAHRTTDVSTYDSSPYNVDGKPSVPLANR